MSADHSDVKQIKTRMKKASSELNNTTNIQLYAHAVTVARYDSDRRKQLLSKYIVDEFKADKTLSHAEAVTRAQANESYAKELDTLQEELKTAHGVITGREGTKTSWETARSLLAWERKSMNELPETEE